MAADPLAGREIFLEIIEQGEFLRVTAVDAATGVEVFATGPRSAPRTAIEKLALGKLARRLFPDEGEQGGASPGRGRLA